MLAARLPPVGRLSSPPRPGTRGLAAPRVQPAQPGRGHQRADLRKPDGPRAAGEAADGAAAAAEPAWVGDLRRGLEDLKKGQKELEKGQKELEKGQKDLKKGQAQQMAISASIFKAAVRGSPATDRGSTVVHTLAELARVCQLPASPQDLQPAFEALAQLDALHCLRAQLVRLSIKSTARAGKAQLYEAAASDWRAATAQPSTEAEWREEEALAGKVLACFVPNSPPHSAFRLWRAICAAAAQDALSPGGRGALLSLLHAAPPPLAWQPDMALAAALVGASQDELELNLPVLVSRSGAGATVTVEEVKLGAAGVGSAKVQLARSVRLVAWLHAVLGQPQPSYVASVVVPCAVRREAEQRLGRRLEEQLPVPQGHGAAHVTWRLSAA